MAFGPLSIRFDDQVLRPRPWTLAQSEWGAKLAAELPAGPVLELCAGAGHIGLALAALSSRDVVLVDANPRACAYARRNADAAALSVDVDVREGPMQAVLADGDRFPLILADPPWVPSALTGQFPEDPLTAIDGGTDGLAVARLCVQVIGRHLADAGASILQLGTEQQAEAVAEHVRTHPAIGLDAVEVRTATGGNGVLVRLNRRA